MTWHVSPSTAHAYVAGTMAEADAWSLEAHLTSCETCRRAVSATAAAHPGISEELARGWIGVAERLPARGRVRRGSFLRGISMLLVSGPAARGAWLLAVVVVLGVALALDLSLAGHTVLGSPFPVLALIAPILPILGVAVSYGSGLDDAYEVIASTPSGGLRLLLIRTLAVLAVSVPAALVAGAFTELGWTGAWLLPCLAMTLLTLALGSAIGVGKAAVAVGVGWAALVVGPALTADVVPALTAQAVPIWLAASVVAGLAVVARRGSFNQLLSSAHHRIGV